jgi:hypothetical protein
MPKFKIVCTSIVEAEMYESRQVCKWAVVVPVVGPVGLCDNAVSVVHMATGWSCYEAAQSAGMAGTSSVSLASDSVLR